MQSSQLDIALHVLGFLICIGFDPSNLKPFWLQNCDSASYHIILGFTLQSNFAFDLKYFHVHLQCILTWVLQLMGLLKKKKKLAVLSCLVDLVHMLCIIQSAFVKSRHSIFKYFVLNMCLCLLSCTVHVLYPFVLDYACPLVLSLKAQLMFKLIVCCSVHDFLLYAIA